MANHASHGSLPYPIKNARFSLLVAYVDADGVPTLPNTPDTEISKDGAAAADCAEEASPVTGMDGMALLTLTGAETNCSLVALQGKVASGPKAPLLRLSPRVLAIVGSGTLSAGSAGGGTLGTVLAYDLTGCFVRTTGGTGGGGVGGADNQARKILTYDRGTGAFTVAPDWETTPDATTTYDVLLPEGVSLGMLKALGSSPAGRDLGVDSLGAAEVAMATPARGAGRAYVSVYQVGATAGAAALDVLTELAAAYALNSAVSRLEFNVVDQPVRYALDGSTPTGSAGRVAVAGETVVAQGLEQIRGFRYIRDTGADAECELEFFAS